MLRLDLLLRPRSAGTAGAHLPLAPLVPLVPLAPLALLALAASLSGCAYQTRPPNAPERVPLPAEVAPADLTIDGKGEVSPETAEDVRVELGKVLSAAHARGGRAGRLEVHVALEGRRDAYDAIRTDGLAVIGLFPAPFGMVTEHEWLSVDVVVTTPSGERLVGHGAADATGGLWAPARRKALALALERALVDASLRASTRGGG